MKITPVIMSGGSGTRLWPVSRKSLPKQFHSLTGEESLFVQTLRRLSGEQFNAPVIVSNFDHRFLVAEALRQADIENGSILLEPSVKDTAPALIAAALHVAQTNPDGIILALPCDHDIKDVQTFLQRVEAGVEAAQQGHLVTFGIQPNKPETGYGYIKTGETLNAEKGIFTIDKFVEKPDEKTAQTYVDSGEFFWNSGMFLYRANAFLDEISTFQPETFALCQDSLTKAACDLNFINLDGESFNKIDGISIDYALWEKTDKAATLPMDCGWSDIGSWNSLADLLESDENNNVLDPHVVTMDSKNCFVKSDGTLINLLGVEDLIVVADDDAILICHKDKSQDIKQLVKAVKEKGYPQASIHSKVYRPWGWYETIEDGKRHKVKHISVKQGAALSLQKHYHRSEHWIVVSGTASVTNGEKQFDLIENQSTYIPTGTVHRLENKGRIPLRIIEIQTGSYLEEDDIERLEDIYKRN